MCAICDGADPDVFFDDMRRRVEEIGWTFVGVEPGPRGPGWVYSVGLTLNFDHPELVVVGLPPVASELVLTSIAETVADGDTYRPHGSYEFGGRRFRFGWVHPRHFDAGTFAWWQEVLGDEVERSERRALQVIPPPEVLRTPRRWRLTGPPPAR